MSRMKNDGDNGYAKDSFVPASHRMTWTLESLNKRVQRQFLSFTLVSIAIFFRPIKKNN